MISRITQIQPDWQYVEPKNPSREKEQRKTPESDRKNNRKEKGSPESEPEQNSFHLDIRT
jgi:hypothetical protein